MSGRVSLRVLDSAFGATNDLADRGVGFGGDTDTIGAMAGALYGNSWIPARWYENIENGKHGRDEIVALAQRLASLDIRSAA